MKEKMNTYIAVLFITVAGSGAALLIVHIATTDVANSTFHSNQASYAALQQSILKSRLLR